MTECTQSAYVFPMVVIEAFGSKSISAAHAASQARNQVFRDLEDVRLLETQSGNKPSNS